MRWPTAPLDTLKSPNRYSFVGGPFGSELTTRDYVADGVPVIRGNNLSGPSKFHDDDFVYVGEKKAKALQSNLASPGDLVFTQRGTLGQVGLIPADARFEKYVISQSQMKLTVDEKKANPLFLYYFFKMPRTIQQIVNRVSSSGVPHINLSVLKAFEVPAPDKDVQDSIVEFVRHYDDLIENNRRRIALLEQAARLLYEEWFVRFRFPGHEHAKFINGLPGGWSWKLLSELAEVNRQSIPSGFDGEIQYIDISSVEPGRIIKAEALRFRDAPSRARRVLAHGDVLWSCVRPNRRSHAIVWNPVENLIGSTGFAVLSPKIVPTYYLYGAVTTDEYVGYLSNNAQGAAYPAVTASVFERSSLVCPDGAILSHFEELTSPILEMSEKLKRQSDFLQRTRDLLLPRLMSGEVEV